VSVRCIRIQHKQGLQCRQTNSVLDVCPRQVICSVSQSSTRSTQHSKAHHSTYMQSMHAPTLVAKELHSDTPPHPNTRTNPCKQYTLMRVNQSNESQTHMQRSSLDPWQHKQLRAQMFVLRPRHLLCENVSQLLLSRNPLDR
jgi:hypothetical protein